MDAASIWGKGRFFSAFAAVEAFFLSGILWSWRRARPFACPWRCWQRAASNGRRSRPRPAHHGHPHCRRKGAKPLFFPQMRKTPCSRSGCSLRSPSSPTISSAPSSSSPRWPSAFTGARALGNRFGCAAIVRHRCGHPALNGAVSARRAGGAPHAGRRQRVGRARLLRLHHFVVRRHAGDVASQFSTKKQRAVSPASYIAGFWGRLLGFGKRIGILWLSGHRRSAVQVYPLRPPGKEFVVLK